MVCARRNLRRQITEDRLKEETMAFNMTRQLINKGTKPESQYRREVTEKNWKILLRDMVQGEIKFPCSDWWHEYLHCVVG